MGSNVLKYLPIGAALLIMIGAAIVQGTMSERWSEFPELKIFSEQLDKIPMQIGEWQGEEAEGSDEKILKIAGAEGELVRTYRNSQGEEVRVSIICARLQDIFAHTPDRCYPAAGFDMMGDPEHKVFEIGPTTAEFFTTSFMKAESSGTHQVRGYWSWSANGDWIAPKNPKYEFISQQHALYKLYIFANVPPGKPKSTDRVYSEDFIRAFMPALERALRPAMEQTGRLTAAAKEAPVEETKEAAKPGA